jgi:hypothetical protein
VVAVAVEDCLLYLPSEKYGILYLLLSSLSVISSLEAFSIRHSVWAEHGVSWAVSLAWKLYAKPVGGRRVLAGRGIERAEEGGRGYGCLNPVVVGWCVLVDSVCWWSQYSLLRIYVTGNGMVRKERRRAGEQILRRRGRPGGMVFSWQQQWACRLGDEPARRVSRL